MLNPSKYGGRISRTVGISIALCLLSATTALLFLLPAVKARSLRVLAIPTEMATGTASASAPTTSTGTVNAQAFLQHIPNGVVRMNYDTNAQTLNLTSTMNGFEPNSTHVVQIEQGSCARPGVAQASSTAVTASPTETASATPAKASSLYSSTVKADAVGQIKGNTTIRNVSVPLTASGLRVNIYDNANNAQNQAVACGNIKPYHPNQGTATPTSPTTQGSSTDTSFQANMGPTASPNEHASGAARLKLADGTLTVQMNVNGLVPNSTSTAQLHSGSCRASGNVAYDMGTLTANAQGKATKTMTFQNVSSLADNSLAAQVRTKDPSNVTLDRPILCGNVHVNRTSSSPTPVTTP